MSRGFSFHDSSSGGMAKETPSFRGWMLSLISAAEEDKPIQIHISGTILLVGGKCSTSLAQSQIATTIQ